MTRKQPIDVVTSQINAAKPELIAYPPSGFGWYKRSIETARELVPWLTEIAPELKIFVEEVVNSTKLVRDSWKKIVAAAHRHIPSELHELMNRELDREAILLNTVSGDVMSKVIEKFLIQNFPGGHLESNGRSDYPDLFLRSKDYSAIPRFARLKDKTKDYGAALKGAGGRPVRIPDGLEIKTCKNRLAVDCHHSHAGLHLVLIYCGSKGALEVTNILVAFMRHCDYRITKPASPTTTLKASFNGKNFVSLLPQIASK